MSLKLKFDLYVLNLVQPNNYACVCVCIYIDKFIIFFK